MTLKEAVLQAIETADEPLLQAVMQVIRSHPTAQPSLTLAEAIALYRESAIAAGLDLDPDEIWFDVRDKTPADTEPRW